MREGVVQSVDDVGNRQLRVVGEGCGGGRVLLGLWMDVGGCLCLSSLLSLRPRRFRLNLPKMPNGKSPGFGPAEIAGAWAG